MKRKHRYQPPQSARAILHQISEVVHNEDRERFELWVAGDLIGVLGYRTEVPPDGGSVITVLHTVLYDEYTGHGLAQRLTRGAIDHIREQGARVRPVCSFTRHYLDRHPGLVPVLAA